MPAYSPFLSGLLNQQPAGGQNLAALAAIQPYLTGQPNPSANTPTIPQYSGQTSTGALAGSLMGKSPQPQPGAPGTAGTSLLNNPQLAGLLQQFFKNQNSGQNPAYGNALADATDAANQAGYFGPTNSLGQLLYGG